MNTINSMCLVDDDEVFTFLTKIIIEETNRVKNVRVFANGLKAMLFLEDALEREPENIPDIILLDINMPIMDGWEFLESYLLLAPKIKKKVTIYVVSSSISYYDVEKAKSISEVTDYFIKPVTKEMFIEMFDNV
jgi:CheY-like chemotaxis protein